MVLSRAWLSFFIAGSGILLLGMAYDATPQRYLSPGGKVDVSFESPDPLFVVDPDRNNSNNAGLRTFRYQIAFYKPGSHTAPIATTDFYDVQTSSREAFPRPFADIFKTLLWSPQEDFVILPREGWPPDKKKTGRKAVSLTTQYAWQTTEFTLKDSPLIWIDQFTVAGNFMDGCKAAVGEFDGRKGQGVVLRQASLPAGYTIVSSSADSILIKKIPGPCASAEEARTIIPECTLYSLSFQRTEIRSCPP